MKARTWILTAVLTGCSDGAPDSTLDGLYTSEQAQRGEALYAQHCARCHSNQEFSGRLFDTVWSGQSLYALYDRIATTMPMDQPGSLGNAQVTALTAHILSLNGMPAGDGELIGDRDWLSEIRIETDD
ncbi:MAG: c-type cytochrome [Pseudomonadota bacterium]